MTFGDAIRTCISKATTWQGRASRSEYWYFVLFSFLCTVSAVILDSILGTSFKTENPYTGDGWFYLLTVLALFLPNLAVMVRRLHDTNHSGWWYWLALVPLAGLVLIVWFCSRGTVGPNEYGSDPLGDDFTNTFD
ncbi:MAG: DUF805 domain-containing protein [Sphingomonadaceae bacterium]